MTNFSAQRQRILVFDSGLGGLSIVLALLAESLDVDLYYVADTAYFPYGDKSDPMLIERIPFIIEKAADKSNTDLVIIACNTASTLALDLVRASVKVPVIGVVPAIKPASALTKSGVIGLLATPKTVMRPYTNKLITDFASSRKVVRYGAIGLAAAAEAYISGCALDDDVVRSSIQGLFDQTDGDQIDVVVLACTHYPLVKAALASNAPRHVLWVDSGAAIAERARSLLSVTAQAAPYLCTAFTTGGIDSAAIHGLTSWGFESVARLGHLT